MQLEFTSGELSIANERSNTRTVSKFVQKDVSNDYRDIYQQRVQSSRKTYTVTLDEQTLTYVREQNQ